MPKVCRVKQRTKTRQKKKGFFKKKDTYVNNVNMDADSVNIVNSDNINTATNDRDEAASDADSTMHAINQSGSSSKIEAVLSPQKDKKDLFGYRLIDMGILSSIFSKLMCPECMTCTLSLHNIADKRKGLASCLRVWCTSCGFSFQSYSSNSNVKGFDINTRVVYAMRECGLGHSGLETFVSLMDMPKPMTARNYDKIVDKLTVAVKEVAEGTMRDACNELRELQNSPFDEKMDVAVSCDGTWQRRGYSSNNGVVSVISVKSGKILDLETMNKICKGCSLKQNLKSQDPDAYEAWKVNHKCTFNDQGSAGGMEPEGGRRIWSRSDEKHNIRYTEFYGDGDSKGFETVKNIYDGVEVQKLECVGHVQKRIGTRIRSLKKREKGLGGRGKLTDATTDRLQNYYGIAIRQNKNNLEGMKKAVRATLFHVASNKENNLHYPHCPEGSDSWCRYNQDKANGTTTYKPGPGLPISIILKLKSIYEDLSSDKLLSKCLHGLTQNNNESFNMTIWERIPKNH